MHVDPEQDSIGRNTTRYAKYANNLYAKKLSMTLSTLYTKVLHIQLYKMYVNMKNKNYYGDDKNIYT